MIAVVIAHPPGIGGRARPILGTIRLVVTWIAVASIMVSALAGCAIQPSTSPVEIPLPTQPQTDNAPDAEGLDRVYFVGPGEGQLLRSVPRDARSLQDLIEILLRGPNEDELAENYFTSIPDDTTINSVSTVGSVLLLDLDAQLTELSSATLNRALAQIVYTAAEQQDIEAVRVSINGDVIEWPGVAGTSVTRLRIYDFPDLVETSQRDYPASPIVAEG